MSIFVLVMIVGFPGMLLGLIVGICLDWGSAVKERHDSYQRYKEMGIDETHLEAIKAGVAEYYLDSEHERQFRWITPKKEENTHENQ